MIATSASQRMRPERRIASSAAIARDLTVGVGTVLRPMVAWDCGRSVTSTFEKKTKAAQAMGEKYPGDNFPIEAVAPESLHCRRA